MSKIIHTSVSIINDANPFYFSRPALSAYFTSALSFNS